MSASLRRLSLVFADQTRISSAAERAHFFKNQIGTRKRRRSPCAYLWFTTSATKEEAMSGAIGKNESRTFESAYREILAPR